MKILIPVRYPITETNKCSIQRGTDLVAGMVNPKLLIFYLNELQRKRRVGRDILREEVEAHFDDLDASHIVRDGFTGEEAIIEEAIRRGRNHIALSQYRHDRWKQLLDDTFALDRSAEDLIRERTGFEIENIGKDGTNPSKE
jgi:hypothetical protein